MAQQGSSSGARLLLTALALGIAVYVFGPPVYWHFAGDSTKLPTSCPICVCDCPNDGLSSTAIAELVNSTMPDCSRDDPDMQEELGKSRYHLLQEELKLQETVAEEAQQRSEAAFLEAKKMASQYQKEFEKCNQGMETSESAREKAEANLVQEKKNSVLWEKRARDLGWKDSSEGATNGVSTLDAKDETKDESENVDNIDHSDPDDTLDEHVGGDSLDSRTDAKKLLSVSPGEELSRSYHVLSRRRRNSL